MNAVGHRVLGVHELVLSVVEVGIVGSVFEWRNRSIMGYDLLNSVCDGLALLVYRGNCSAYDSDLADGGLGSMLDQFWNFGYVRDLVIQGSECRV